LFNSTAGCLNVNSFNISYLNQPHCLITKSVINSYSLSILFKQTNCDSQPSIASWELILIIIVITVVGLAIIVLALVLLIPSLRSKIFVTEEVVKQQKKKDIKKVEERVKDLKSEIKGLKDEHKRVENLLIDD